MALPRITVVTPSYNQGRYLRETLESVLGQGYPALESIVMDGGSTDESVTIIQSYAPRLAHWESEKDKGQADAIRRGFARATGDVLGWLNSDDTLAPGTLAAVGAYFASHPEIDLVYSDVALVDANGGPLYTARPRLRWQTLAYENAFVPQQSMYWRRALYEKVGGLDASLRFAMDLDLALRFLLSGAKVVKLPGVLAHYRWHEAAKSSTLRDVLESERAALIARHLPQIAAEGAVAHFLKRWAWRAVRFAQEPRSLASALLSRART